MISQRPLSAAYKRAVVVGDSHFGKYSNSREWLAIMLSWFLRSLLPDLLRRYPTEEARSEVALILLGDTTESKDLISTVVQNAIERLILELSRYFDVYILVGNHDTPLLTDTTVNTIRTLRHLPGVEIIDKPREVAIVGNATMLLQPWAHSKEILIKGLEEASPDCEYVFAHNSVEGFHYEGKEVEGGKYPKKDDYAGFRGVYLGHIHLRQKQEHICYVGSPYQTSFTEVGNPCGYLLLDFATGDEEFVDNTHTPRFLKVSYLYLLNLPYSKASELVAGNFVRAIFPLSLPPGVNPGRLTSVLTSARSLECRNDNRTYDDENPLAIEHDGELPPPVADLGERLEEFLGTLKTVKIGKQEIQLTPQYRAELLDLLQELRVEAEATLTSAESIEA